MRLSQKIAGTYYTAFEARSALGLNDDTFQGWVKAEKVKKIILPGRKQGVYLKKEIDTLAASIDAAVLMMQSMSTDFRKATLDQQEKEFELAIQNFGEQTSQFHEYRRQLLEKNPDMSYYLYDGEFMVASINIVPLNSEGIAKFKQGERGWHLGNYVEPFSPGKPLECIIIDMMTTSLSPANKRAAYGKMLMLNLMTTFENWVKQDIQIASIYACGGTPDGEHILKKAEFVLISDPHARRRIYELAINNSSARWLKPYKVALAEHQQKRGEN